MSTISVPGRLSHYEIARKLGQGGMGVVYLARDLDLDRLVALKFLPDDLARSPERIARFRNEARAISALNHPHIATIYGIEDTGELPFLAFEYLPGGTLREKLAAWGDSLPQMQALEWGLEIAEALAHAHSRGIVHRDIKSSNALFTEEGRLKLTDFGLAKFLASRESGSWSPADTQSGCAMGTPQYMSPEQARGLPADERSDVFSLGVLLFEMITGRMPFEAPDTPVLLHQIVYEPAPSLEELRGGIDPRLEVVIARTLAKDPEDRYANAGELARALRPICGVSSRPAILEDTVTLEIPARRSRRRPLLAIAAAALTAAALLAAVAPGARRQIVNRIWTAPIPAEKRIAVLPFANVGGDAANQPLADGLMEVVSNSLTRLEQFHGALTVIPASDVRKENIGSARDAGRILGANLAITGSITRISPRDVLVLINLVDTRSVTQLRSETIRARVADLAAVQDGVVERVARILELALAPQAAQAARQGDTTVREAFPHYVEGLGYLRRYDRPQNIDDAISAFSRALALDPNFVLANVGAAQAYWRKYDLTKEGPSIDAALEHAARALALNDQLASAHITMGMIRAGKGQYEDAEKEMKTALQLDPLNADAYRELALAYEAMGRAGDAESTYRKAIGLRKDDWWSVKQLGVFYLNHGRYPEAERLFKEVIRLTPNSAKAYSNLGAAYVKMGRKADAAAQLEHSLQIEPSALGYSNLGGLYYFEGRFADAAAKFEKATEQNPTDSRFWMNLADSYRWTPALASKAPATFRRAIELMEREISVNPRDAQLRAKLATSWAALGEREKAISEIGSALAIAPADGAVRYRAALVYEQAGQRDRALREIDAALKARYSRTEILNAPPLHNLTTDPRFKRLESRF